MSETDKTTVNQEINKVTDNDNHDAANNTGDISEVDKVNQITNV